MCLHSHLLSYNLKVAINLMHDQHFTYLISFWDVILAPLFLCVTFSVFLLLFLNVFSPQSPAVMITFSLDTIYSPSTPLSLPHVLMDEKSFRCLIGEWCCYLESQSISTEGGERKETEKSSGGEVAPWGVVAVMGELSNAPLSKLPSKHHAATQD